MRILKSGKVKPEIEILEMLIQRKLARVKTTFKAENWAQQFNPHLSDGV